VFKSDQSCLLFQPLTNRQNTPLYNKFQKTKFQSHDHLSPVNQKQKQWFANPYFLFLLYLLRTTLAGRLRTTLAGRLRTTLARRLLLFVTGRDASLICQSRHNKSTYITLGEYDISLWLHTIIHSDNEFLVETDNNHFARLQLNNRSKWLSGRRQLPVI